MQLDCDQLLVLCGEGLGLDLNTWGSVMAQFWLVSGDHANSHLYEALAPTESWNGPFGDYESAQRAWRGVAQLAVRTDGIRYRIERFDPDTLSARYRPMNHTLDDPHTGRSLSCAAHQLRGIKQVNMPS